MNVYLYDNYRNLLNDLVASNRSIKGYQTRLAAAMKCSKSLLSQVLKGDLELTSDHVARLCAFLRFEYDAAEYLLTLLHLSKAGTDALKSHLQSKISRLREKHSHLSTRIDSGSLIDDMETRAKYCSSWVYPAVHMAVLVEKCRTIDDMAELLKVDTQLLQKVLEDMLECGLLERSQDGFRATDTNVHIDKQSILANNLQLSWRNRSLQRCMERRSSDLFYSGVHVADQRTFDEIREDIIMLLQSSRKKIDSAKPQHLFYIGTDIYSF